MQVYMYLYIKLFKIFKMWYQNNLNELSKGKHSDRAFILPVSNGLRSVQEKRTIRMICFYEKC